MRKKVLIFTPGSVGGAERMAITFGKILAKEDYTVTIVIIGVTKDLEKFIPDNLKTIRIPIKKIYHGGITRIANVIRKERPEFTFSSMIYLNWIVIFTSWLFGIKCIVRNNIGLSDARKWIKATMKFTYPKAYHIIAQQEDMKEELVSEMRLPSDKVVVIHNPLDIDTINKALEASSPYVSNDEKRIVFAGRFDKSKGQDVLVKAFVTVRKYVKNAHLYLIGKYQDGEDTYESCKQIISDANISKYVHFVGFDENPYRWEKYADCYVLPSRKEGLPNSLIEAMYIGLPVVATTSIPIISHIVDDGENGYLCPVADAETMADRIVKALKLKNFKMTYKPAEAKDVLDLFT